jgi:hypothetical protein
MELFHIHTLVTYDELYQPNSIISVDELFNNGIYHSIFNLDMSLTSRNLPRIFEAINKDLRSMDVKTEVTKSRVDELMRYMQFFGYDEKELKTFFDLASNIIKRYHTAMNEIAYENSRGLYCPDKPSRLYSMFACDEDGVSYWDSVLKSKKADVYKIEVSDEPLLTNPSLLPNDDLYLYNKVTEARRYFEPSNIQKSSSNEYLVTGKVLIKEKVREIRRR